MRHTMFFDQVEHVVRARTGAENDACALHHETLHAGAGQRQVMADRQEQQQAAILKYLGILRRELRIEPVIVMGPRDQLRHTGCPARELEDRGISRIDLDRIENICGGNRFAVHQFGEGQKPVRRVAINNSLCHAGVFRLNARNHRRELEITLTVRRDTHLRLGDLRELAELVIAMRRQGADRNGADFLKRKIEIRKLDHVRQHDHHAVKRPQAQVPQVQSQLLRRSINLGIGDRHVSVDDRNAVGIRAEQVIGELVT